jgi:large subunit ribosomal protein L15
VDLAALKAANLVHEQALRARVVASGTVSKALTVKGVHLTKGAKAAIESAGGKVEA